MLMGYSFCLMLLPIHILEGIQSVTATLNELKPFWIVGIVQRGADGHKSCQEIVEVKRGDSGGDA